MLITGTGGIIAGVAASVIANYLYLLSLPIFVAWGAMGIFLGLFLIKAIPNLQPRAGLIGGGVGGLLGGILFVWFSFVINEAAGRILGAMAIGCFIGTMISLAENLFKEAWVEIEWQENEKSIIGLGKKPIIIGTASESDILLPKQSGFSQIIGRITFEKGVIYYNDEKKGTKTLLRNGSKIELGGIKITVNAVK